METSRYKLRITNYELRILLLCAFVPLWFNSFSQTEQKVSSTISNVTVFINQAQITRVAKFSVDAGVTVLVFDKVSPFINLNSIQVRIDGNVTLLSVSNRKNYLKENEKPKHVILLEDSLEKINAALADFKADKETIVFQKDLMLANKNVGSNQTGVKSDDLDDLIVLYKKKLNEFKTDWFRLSNLEIKYSAAKQKIENQLREFQNSFNLNSPEILVTVKSHSAVNDAKIEIDYIVKGASWKPFYDIRVKDIKSPLQLVSKAYITQNTSEDWKNIIIKLSTSNPNEGGLKPDLQTNYLKFNNPVQRLTSRCFDSESSGTKPSQAAGGVNKNEELQYSSGIASVQQTAVSIEFNVTSAYNIPSDNTPHQVDLTASNLDAVYSYSAVPKLDKDAFITAKVSGNDLVNQISGEANVYFDGTFVGKTFINGTTNDSLTLSLGRDKRVQIQRLKLKDFSSKTFSGSNRKELNTWEIKLRNTRKEPILIFVEDQIPVSSDKEIEVKLLNAENARYDETTGKLTWTIILDAEQSQSVKFSFEVKYPKEKIISEY
ncbi:MAG: DUF4139 domain-containing protein [Bacteroidota bacterium]